MRGEVPLRDEESHVYIEGDKVIERERVCVCVCVCEREREREKRRAIETSMSSMSPILDAMSIALCEEK